jgi:hypothetical protein
MGAVALALLVFFLGLYLLRGFRFPVGADAPVYLWWSRLAAHQGVAAVGTRSGVPALVLMVSALLHLPVMQVLGGMGAALGTGVGLAAAAFVRAGISAWDPGRPLTAPSALAGLLAGAFSVHLVEGYFATLAFVAVFLAALAALAPGTRAGAAGAAALLGAGAILHPLFFLAGAVILALAAAPTMVRRPPGTRLRDTEGARIAAALGAGAAIGAAGLGAVAAAGGVYHADTSKDTFYRRMGLSDALRSDYVYRLTHRVARYWLPIAVPLSAFAASATRGFLGRVLRAWGVVLVAGALLALATGLLPADRFITFGFVLPIGSALGIVELYPRLARRGRLLSRAASVVLAGLMLAGAVVTWLRETPYMTPDEVRAATRAAAWAEATPRATPLVFLVDNRSPTLSFLTARAGNVLRAAVPPGRVRHVYLYVGSPRNYLAGRPTLYGPQALAHDTFSREYLRELRAAGGHPVAFVLRPFNPSGFAGSQRHDTGVKVAPGVVVLGSPPAHPVPFAGVISPTPSWRYVAAGVELLALLCAIGLGWALAWTSGVLDGLAVAAGAGVTVLVLAGLALDRAGALIVGGAPRYLAAALAVLGYGVAFVVRRRRRGDEGLGVHQGHPAEDPPPELQQ